MKKLFLITALMLLVLVACKKDKDDEEVVLDTPDKLDDYVRDMPSFSQPFEDTEGKAKEKEVDVEESESQICVTSEVTISEGSSEFFLLDPTTDIIYPGALLLGNSIPSGEYTPIVADRAPITFSVSIPTVNQTSSNATVDNPKLSSVRTEVNNLLNQMEIAGTPSYMSKTMQTVNSTTGVSRALSVSYGDPVKELGLTLTQDLETQQTTIIAKFVQKFYTIDLDYPQSPSAWFKDGKLPSKEDIGESSPVYVSSVTYGRMAIIAFQSSESAEKFGVVIDAALKAAGGAGGEVSTELSQEQESTFANASIKATVIGGDAKLAADLMSINNSTDFASKLNDFISEGAEWSVDNPGVMLSYKIRHLSDNSIANVILADRYMKRDCSRSKLLFDIEMTKWNVKTNDGATGTECEVSGKVKASLLDPSGNKIQINGNDYHYFWDRGETSIEQNDIYTNFDDPKFSYVHDVKDPESNTVSAKGYKVRFEIESMKEHDDFFEGGSDDNLNAEAVEVDLGDLTPDSESETKEVYLHVKGDGYIDIYFKISVK